MYDNQAFSFAKWWIHPQYKLIEIDNTWYIEGVGTPEPYDPFDVNKTEDEKKDRNTIYDQFLKLNPRDPQTYVDFANDYGLLGIFPHEINGWVSDIIPDESSPGRTVREITGALTRENKKIITIEEIKESYKPTWDNWEKNFSSVDPTEVSIEHYEIISPYVFNRERIETWTNVLLQMRLWIEFKQSSNPKSVSLADSEITTHLNGCSPILSGNEWNWSYRSLISAMYLMLTMDLTSGNKEIKKCANERCKRNTFFLSTKSKYCSDPCRRATDRRKYYNATKEQKDKKTLRK